MGFEKTLLYTVGAVLGGIAAGTLIMRAITKHTEKRLGGKLMHVQYRFSKDFEK